MHSPLRVKIQNALNKAFQLEKTDVLFVGGRRQNRKRRKHAKDKKKSKKYEGKGTPVLKAKTYNGNKGKYVALVADDDISLSPSMVDELFYGTKANTISINCDGDEASIDAISVNQADANNKEESVYDDNDEETIDVPELSYTETSLQEEMKLAEIKNDEERHRSCDTGYNSEEDHRIRTTSESEDEIQLNDNDSQLDCGSNLNKQENNTEDDDVFVDEKEEGFNESFVSEEDDITHQENNLNEKNVVMVSEKTEVDNTELNDDYTELTDKEVTDSRVEQNLKDGLEKVGLHEVNVPDITLKKPRIIANFDYDEEEEEEIYTKQPKSWFRRKPEEDEELRPLICCGDENGVGFACCTIL